MRPHGLPLAALTALNLWIMGGLTAIVYSAHMGSIEAAYVSLSEQILRHGFGLGWWPLWYGGIPFQNTYPPVLHVLVALWAKLTGASAALAHHQVTAAVYTGGALAVYGLAWRLSRQRISAFLAALLWSVVSPSAWLISAVRADIGSLWHARRLNTLVIYGEGPHLTSLALLPLALWALERALERRTKMSILVAALALAATVLSNWLGAFGLAAGVICLLFDRERKQWTLAIGTGVLAYVLASPWIPPTTLLAIRENAQRIGGDFRVGLPQLAGVAALFLAAGLIARRIQRPLLKFALPYAVVMGGITLAAEWRGIFLLPQPQRYHLEMELGLALVMGALGRSRGVMVLALVAALYPAFRYRDYAAQLISPAEITRTSEYRVARWFDQHAGGARVMAPGSIGFWMNAFTDTPQLGGGFDQGIINAAYPGAHFQILSGMGAGAAEGRIAADWLKVFAVSLVAVSGPGSTEVYHPFANPRKFDGVLEEVWRDGGDVIYRVPLRSPSLARVVREADLVSQLPAYFHETAPLQPFLEAIEEPSRPLARWRWTSRSEAVIEAELTPADVVAVAVSYHPGWEAETGGRALAVDRDGLGLIVVRPQCTGTCTVKLRYTGGREQQVTQALSWIALAGGLILGWRRRTP